MVARKHVFFPALFVLLFGAPLLAAGITIKGKVVEVQGSKVKIEYGGEYAPNAGDPVEIGFEIDEELIPVEGGWKIVEVSAEFAWAQAERAGAGTPAVDYLAIIHSNNPVTRSEIVPDAEEYFRTAIKYISGDGVKQDYTKAVPWLKKSAELGYPEAQCELGGFYEGGKGGLPEDRVEAFKWYHKAAELGEPLAQRQVGFMYVMGLGVRPNVAEAEKWYRNAETNWPWKDSRPLDDFADKLILGALANGYMTMEEVEQKTLELYRESARKGSDRAQEKLREKGLSW